jgi:ribosome-associated heat shock protein Hsp15
MERGLSWHDGQVEVTRVDRWLWAVRVCKTRAAATTACRGGHVRVNGTPAKPATSVRVGDRVEATIHGQLRSLEVARVIDKRVGAPAAAECVIDHSPPPPTREERTSRVFARDRGSGRPTKRDRRQLDRFRNR